VGEYQARLRMEGCFAKRGGRSRHTISKKMRNPGGGFVLENNSGRNGRETCKVKGTCRTHNPLRGNINERLPPEESTERSPEAKIMVHVPRIRHATGVGTPSKADWGEPKVVGIWCYRALRLRPMIEMSRVRRRKMEGFEANASNVNLASS